MSWSGKPCCKARGDAHFWWCAKVGGPGRAPSEPVFHRTSEEVVVVNEQLFGSHPTITPGSYSLDATREWAQQQAVDAALRR